MTTIDITTVARLAGLSIPVPTARTYVVKDREGRQHCQAMSAKAAEGIVSYLNESPDHAPFAPYTYAIED